MFCLFSSSVMTLMNLLLSKSILNRPTVDIRLVNFFKSLIFNLIVPVDSSVKADGTYIWTTSHVSLDTQASSLLSTIANKLTIVDGDVLVILIVNDSLFVAILSNKISKSGMFDGHKDPQI